MNYKLTLFILFFLLVIPLTLADGLCELDKYNYHILETGTVTCSCDSPTEKNKPGYFVWKNGRGDLIQSTPTNSFDCINDIFFDTHTFIRADGTPGNVTFSLNADGSGTPVNWGNFGDVRYDTWNVSDASLLDCKIIDVISLPPIIGGLGSVKITVVDGVTNNSLVNANCQADGYDIDGKPILYEPYGGGRTSRVTLASGEVGFQHFMDERQWETNKSYLYEFHCVCFNNTDEDTCYDETTGTKTSFKSCTAKFPFTTSLEDYREGSGSERIATVVGLGIIAILFITLGLWSFFTHNPKPNNGEPRFEWRDLVSLLFIYMGFLSLLVLLHLLTVNSIGATHTVLNTVFTTIMWIFVFALIFGVIGAIIQLLRWLVWNVNTPAWRKKEIRGK